MDYKEDIISTRKGYVGSSDGAMLERIARDNKVPGSFAKRLAVIKGLIPSTDGIKTAAMELGDKVENFIFSMLSEHGTGNYESNPRWVSKVYVKKNFSLLSHPDIVKRDEDKKTLTVYEVKSTQYDVEQTLESYKGQLYIHSLLAKEQVPEGWKTEVYLVHYDTNYQFNNVIDPKNITIRKVTFDNPPFDILEAMDILDKELDSFTYEEQENVDVDSLPIIVQTELKQIGSLMSEIKEREAKIAEFKETLYEFLCSNNIKSIKNDIFNISRVDPTESKSFDSRAFMKDIEKNDPEWAKELKGKYTKVSKRDGYALIKIK